MCVCVCLLIVHGVHAAQCGRCRLRTYPPCLWYSLSALTAHTHSPNSVHKNSLNACIFTMFIHVRCELRRMCVWCVCVCPSVWASVLCGTATLTQKIASISFYSVYYIIFCCSFSLCMRRCCCCCLMSFIWLWCGLQAHKQLSAPDGRE